METVIEFFNYLIEQAQNLPDVTDSYWERIITWLMITYLEAKLMTIEIAYYFANIILSSLNISDLLAAGWSSIDSQILAVFTYLRIPEAINMILSAFVTRFVLGLMP
jgi:hypothetical protein